MSKHYVHKKAQPRVKQISVRERIRIGSRLAQSMEPQMTLQAVADQLGLSYQAVQRAEALALYKVQVRLKELVS